MSRYETDFKDKVVLVTGAAQGIGKSIAEAFALAGAKTIFNDINPEVLNRTVDELRAKNAVAIPYLADVSVDQDVDQMITRLVKEYGSIDILVNNAGVSLKNADNSKKKTIEISADEWDFILATNLKSVFLCSKYAALNMIKNQSGKIINLSSILGKSGCAGDKMDNFHPISSTSASHYCASKAAIINFTRSLARELAEYSINVNALAPGAVSGGMGKFGGEVVERMKTQIPLRRLADQEDVVEGALFLASDRAKYITGETLNINGGWLMS